MRNAHFVVQYTQISPKFTPMFDQALKDDIKNYIAPYKSNVKRRASGMLKHDYLVPAGPYEEQWDWDAFFIGMALAAEVPSEAIFLKNWALNYIENSKEDGFTPGLVTPEGPDDRLNQMKPLLAQGSYAASHFLNDYEWLRKAENYLRLCNVVMYRENHGCFDKERYLGGWTNSMESGADNNLASLDYPDNSVLSVDFNCFLYLEYRAMDKIDEALGRSEEEREFGKRAEKLKNAILSHMWCEEDQTFYNIDLQTGEFIKVVGYSSVHPFWANIASQEQADAFFERYFLNEEEMLAPHGIRTLTKSHEGYNNVNMIKPHSNWQGPVWPITNYIYTQSLMNYGYKEAAMENTQKVVRICVNDIKKSGGMHECYNAETGEALAAPNFISWNLLLVDLPNQIERNENPFLIS